MRFNCYRLENWLEAREQRRLNWHPWFAWRPVSVGNECVWWEWIERKITFRGWFEREYRYAATK